MVYTKADMVKSIREQIGFTHRKSEDTVESFLDILKQSLKNGEDVTISGFGKFCIKQKNARKGRNPQTGEELTLEPRKIVTFRSSKKLNKSLNEK